MESLTIDVYPKNKGSLILLNLDNLRLPSDVDWRSLNLKDDKGRKIIFDLVNIKNKKNNLKYNNKIKENTLAIILNNFRFENLILSYKRGNKKSNFSHPNKKISLNNDKSLRISAKKVEINFEKEYFSIDSFNIGSDKYGPLQFVASGGTIKKQNNNFKDVEYEILSDSNIIKIIRITGKIPVVGSKVNYQGYLPLDIHYYFWSYDGSNIYCDVDVKILYENAKSLDGKKVPFLEPLLWYSIENSKGNVKFNELISNDMESSKIVTLKKPYYSYIKSGQGVFSIMPNLALPNDGIHIELCDDWFGASWHSLSSKKKPYWNQLFDKSESTGFSQGFYPAHSVNSYWKIGLFFGEGNPNEIARIFTYRSKIKSITHQTKGISNPFITHWKDNSSIALNAISDDGKLNDYLWRKDRLIPLEMQIALSTRKKFISYTRYCLINNKIFYLKMFPRISKVISTFLCAVGIGKPIKNELAESNFSLIPHTNTHPIIWKSSEEKIKEEISKSESVWVNDFKLSPPLSHVFSYPSPYGIPTKNGTREYIAFSASDSLQWIREWPIPNAPTDFFLPSRLYWGISTGGDLEDKKVCDDIKSELNLRYKDGADYMQVSGHLPEKVQKSKNLRNLFSYISKIKGLWLASADDIIKYYKSREDISFGRIEKKKCYWIVSLKKELPDIFNTEITLIQKIGDNALIECKIEDRWNKVKYNYLDKKNKTIIYNISSATKELRFSTVN